MEAVGHYQLEIEQGGTFRRAFRWLNDAGAAINLAGCHVRARIFPADTPNPALALTDQAGDFTIRDQSIEENRGWFDMNLSDEKTDTLLWTTGFYRLDILHPDGTATPLLKGPVNVNPRTGQ